MSCLRALEPQEMSESAPFLRVWMGSTSVSEFGSYRFTACPASLKGKMRAAPDSPALLLRRKAPFGAFKEDEQSTHL
jgi:hypothetical protein